MNRLNTRNVNLFRAYIVFDASIYNENSGDILESYLAIF